jgi:hypothetical protein
MRGFITAKATNPTEQNYSVTITLPIYDWIVFLDQIKAMKGNNSYPAFHVIDGISNVVNNAHEIFSTSITNE